jgi:uncharacterized RDD family membrane protein YckC
VTAASQPKEAVAYAGWGDRFVAWLIDSTIVWGTIVVLGLALRFATETRDEEGQGADLIVVLLAILVAPLYFALLHSGDRGQTLGKRAAGIAVKDEKTRGRLSFGRSVGRAYAALILWAALCVGGILDALWPLWDSKNQALHDKAVASIVLDADR